MAAVLSPQTEGVRAALVYQAVALSDALKAALAEAGVQVVVELRADALDRAALDQAAPQVFVINLDPDLEDHLDELTEVLDGYSRPVIFNDAAASSGLAGWDQARWARHLGAKIKGEVDAHPPRPEGSVFIPPPERKLVQIAAPRSVAEPAAAPVSPPLAAPAVVATPVVKPPPAPAPAQVAAVAPPAPAPAVATDLSVDVDAMFGDLLGDAGPAPAASTQAPTVELPVVHLPRHDSGPTQSPSVLAEFDLGLDSQPQSTAVSETITGFDPGASMTDADAIWLEESQSEDSGFSGFGSFEQNFDAPLEGESMADFELPEVPPRAVEAELTDLDDLFRELAPEPAAVVPSKVAAVAAAPSVPDPAAARKPAELKAPPMDWSLEPLEGEGLAQAPVPTGRAQFSVGQDVASAVPVAPPAAAASPAAVAPVEASDQELDAFDFFFEPSAGAPAPVSDVTAVADKPRAPLNLADIPDFGFSLEALDDTADAPAPAPAPSGRVAAAVAAPQAVPPAVAPAPAAPVPAPAPAASAPVAGNELGAFDFNFDNFDDPPSGSRVSTQRHTEAAALADLEGLFADIEAPPVVSDVPNLDRVWILGASIGGPEAVRSFLTGLKKQVASAFILAQHMGSEFLDLMIAQLAKASPLPVKVAQAGDKLQNGSVLVAPVGKRLTVDAQGRVQLGEMSGDMPYSPSIDQIMFDMADRFGPRCSAVIFSGMASDAIEGAKYIASKGGRIWVQDPSTCVISSMIDGAQAAGVVSYVGTPEQLSEHLQAHLL